MFFANENNYVYKGSGCDQKNTQPFDLWLIKHKPWPVAYGPPADVFPAYDEQPGPSMDDYIRDLDYPAESYFQNHTREYRFPTPKPWIFRQSAAKFRLDNAAGIRYPNPIIGCRSMIAVWYLPLLNIRIQPVMVHNFKFSLDSISKRKFYFLIIYDLLRDIRRWKYENREWRSGNRVREALSRHPLT